jgi:hypothetical protein
VVTVKWSEISAHERNVLVADKVMGHPGEYRHFSTDISAAWKVVEKMVAEGWEPSIEYSSHGYPWTVWMGHDALDAGVGHGDTVPSAICLSALRAVGVDI